MALERISFDSSLNTSLQVGDKVYSAQQGLGGVTSEPTYVGTVFEIHNHGLSFDLDIDVSIVGQISTNDFILFSKPITINEASIKGYYANITLENHSRKYIELFSIGSEITASSK